MKYYTFKNGSFTLRVPGEDEADARKALPDDPDFGDFELVSVEETKKRIK
jgi:hypothetical protein